MEENNRILPIEIAEEMKNVLYRLCYECYSW